MYRHGTRAMIRRSFRSFFDGHHCVSFSVETLSHLSQHSILGSQLPTSDSEQISLKTLCSYSKVNNRRVKGIDVLLLWWVFPEYANKIPFVMVPSVYRNLKGTFPVRCRRFNEYVGSRDRGLGRVQCGEIGRVRWGNGSYILGPDTVAQGPTGTVGREPKRLGMWVSGWGSFGDGSRPTRDPNT